MQIGVVGLGRMGANISLRLMRGGHQCAVYDRAPEPVRKLEEQGAIPGSGLQDLVQKLAKPRIVWVMLPAGAITEATIAELAGMMEPGDIIIDGGNSFFHDDIRRAKELAAKGLHYVDVGTSGGVWGLERGYCMMIGGASAAVSHLTPIFETLAPGTGDVVPTPGGKASSADRGYIHAGPAGAGHFVKMIHNGIEYGIMQAYAEGFDILKSVATAPEVPEERRFALDLPEIAEVWRRGSVIGSWLLDLTAMALAEDPDLAAYSGFVQDSGEGRWTINAAIEEAVPAEVLTAALYARFRSRQKNTYADKLLSAMRQKFGGHVEPKTEH
jgi:6-phosphogluconate dehydrogenase